MERNGIASLPISARVRTASESDDQNGLADGGREPGQGSGDGHADQHADPRPGTRSARPERHEDEQHRQPEHQHDREPDHDRPDLARTGAHHVRPEVGQVLDSGGQRNAGRHGCGSRSHNSSVQDLCTLVDARTGPATASSISLLPGTSGVPTARECSRLGAPTSARYGWAVRSPSSSGLGHRPFKAAARVRIPLGMPTPKRLPLRISSIGCRFCIPPSGGLGHARDTRPQPSKASRRSTAASDPSGNSPP